MRLASILLVPALVSTVQADTWDGPDKRAHFVVGFGVAANTSVLAHVVSDDATERALLGAGFGLLAGAGKEGLDALGAGTPSLPDFVWTAAGATAGALLLWLVEALAD